MYAWALLRDCVKIYGRTLSVDFSKSGEAELDEPLQKFWDKAQRVSGLTNDTIMQYANQHQVKSCVACHASF